MGLPSRFLARVLSPFVVIKAAEGEWRPGPYMLNDGWLPAGSLLNFWQAGEDVIPYSTRSAMVQACVSAYSQTVAMCPGDHWRRLDNGGRERVTTSALNRILRRPNDYQSISDFLMNATRSLYSTGNAYALATRNERAEIAQLHLMDSRHCFPRIAVTGEIFYDLGGNELVERRFGSSIVVPARDVLHIRLDTPRHPLKGESPLMAAALDVAASDAMMQQQLAFYLNQARPSFVLSSDQVMTRDQSEEASNRWNEKSRGLNRGGTVVLSNGLKVQALQATAEDSQLAEIMKMTDQNIALAFRVPLAVLGIGGQTYSSTEMLMQSWIATGLGFALNHIEVAFDALFGLRGYPEEYLELNTRALLRSAFKDRIEGLARSTISGIHSPDEARAEEDLPAVPGGAGREPRVQQQVVPLSYGVDMKPPAATPAPAPEQPGATSEPAPAEEEADEERHITDDVLARLYAQADASRQLH